MSDEEAEPSLREQANALAEKLAESVDEPAEQEPERVSTDES